MRKISTTSKMGIFSFTSPKRKNVLQDIQSLAVLQWTATISSNWVTAPKTENHMNMHEREHSVTSPVHEQWLNLGVFGMGLFSFTCHSNIVVLRAYWVLQYPAYCSCINCSSCYLRLQVSHISLV